MVLYSYNKLDTVTTTITHSDSDSTGTGVVQHIAPKEFYVLSYNDYPCHYELQEKIDDFLKELKKIAKIYKSQWILRNGFKLKFNSPNFNKPTIPIIFRKILRCNRKGIGLRMRSEK